MSENKFLDLKKVFQAGLQELNDEPEFLEEESIYVSGKKETDLSKEESSYLKIVANSTKQEGSFEEERHDLENIKKSLNEDVENLEQKVTEFKADWEKQQIEFKRLISELRQSFVDNKEDLLQTINKKSERAIDTTQTSSEDIENLEKKVAAFKTDWEKQQSELKHLISELRQSFIDNKEDLLQMINEKPEHSIESFQTSSEDIENLEKKVAEFKTDWEKQQTEFKRLISELRQSFVDNKEELIQSINKKPSQLIQDIQSDLSAYEPEWIEKFQSSIHRLTEEIESQHKEKLESQVFPLLKDFQEDFFQQLEKNAKKWREETLDAVNKKILQSELQASNLEKLLIKMEAWQANKEIFLTQSTSKKQESFVDAFDADFKNKKEQQLHDKLVEQNQALEQKVDTLLDEIDTLKDVQPASSKREKNNMSLMKIVRTQSWLLISLFLLVGLSMSAFYSYIFNQYSNLVLILTAAIVLLGISLFIFIYQMVYSYKKPNISKKQKH